jgi:alpha-mannosidase
LLWPQIVPNLSELQAILAAAIKLVQPKFELPEADHAAVRKYVAYLHKVLPATQIELIAGAATPLLAGTVKLDLAAWLAEADESANRAGSWFAATWWRPRARLSGRRGRITRGPRKPS